MTDIAKIKEVFTSIQGEGPFVGYKQLFVRFCGCNLSCKYCDTDYRTVDSIEYTKLVDTNEGESSADIKLRVDKARQIQLNRFKNSGIYNNAEMGDSDVKKHCAVSSESAEMLKFAFDKLNLSARAYSRILKVARTIADLEGEENITDDAIMEAISYRTLDNKYWD